MKTGSLRILGDLQAGVYQRIYTKHVTVADDFARDSYDVLNIHFSGADGATTYTAETGQTVTFIGTAQLDTAQYKFSPSCLLLDGNSDYVTLPDSNNWNFGTGNFTIDFWVRFNSVATKAGFCGQYVATSGGTLWSYYWAVAGTLNFQAKTAGAINAYYHCDWSPSVDTWYHIAIVRSGSTCYMFVDGVSKSVTEETAFGTLPDVGANLHIGTDGQVDDYFLNGWIAEVRISKGIARWTSNFTPPTAPYGVTSLTISGLTGNTDEEYILRTRIIGGNTTSNVLLLRPNNDSGNNYGCQFLYGENTTVSVSRSIDSGIRLYASGNALNNLGFCSTIIYAKSGYIRTAIGKMSDKISGTTVIGVQLLGSSWNNTADEITSLVVISGQNGGIGAGSFIELFKLVQKS